MCDLRIGEIPPSFPVSCRIFPAALVRPQADPNATNPYVELMGYLRGLAMAWLSTSRIWRTLLGGGLSTCANNGPGLHHVAFETNY